MSKNEKNQNENIQTILIYLFVPLIIGFTILYFINYKKVTKGYKLQELVLLMKGNCYHIHHSMVMLLIIISIIIGRFLQNDLLLVSIIGLLLGISMEDLLFKDWDLVKNNCHKTKLIKFMKNTTDIDSKYN